MNESDIQLKTTLFMLSYLCLVPLDYDFISPRHVTVPDTLALNCEKTIPLIGSSLIVTSFSAGATFSPAFNSWSLSATWWENEILGKRYKQINPKGEGSI